jgi:hypothetical protein
MHLDCRIQKALKTKHVAKIQQLFLTFGYYIWDFDHFRGLFAASKKNAHLRINRLANPN